MKIQQVWKDVLGYEGLYQVSNLGRVKSLNYRKSGKENILKERKSIIHHKSRDYILHSIGLFKNGKEKTFIISRLVFQAFKGKIPEKMQVDHINNNPQDNRLDNLQLLTHSENNKKRYVDNKDKWPGFSKKKIVCLNNNIIYESINEASRKLNLNIGGLSSVLKGRLKSIHGYKFQYIDDNNKDKDDEQQLQLFK